MFIAVSPLGGVAERSNAAVLKLIVVIAWRCTGGLEIDRECCTGMQGMAFIPGIWHSIAGSGIERHARWHQGWHQASASRRVRLDQRARSLTDKGPALHVVFRCERI